VRGSFGPGGVGVPDQGEHQRVVQGLCQRAARVLAQAAGQLLPAVRQGGSSWVLVRYPAAVSGSMSCSSTAAAPALAVLMPPYPGDPARGDTSNRDGESPEGFEIRALMRPPHRNQACHRNHRDYPNRGKRPQPASSPAHSHILTANIHIWPSVFLAVEGSHFYWADAGSIAGTGTIMQAKFDGSGLTTLESGQSNLLGVAVGR